MFDLEKSFGFDRTLANQGAKRMLGVNEDEYILLCRIPNPDYKSMLAKEYRAHSQALEVADDDTKNKLSEQILSRVVAYTVVKGWGKGFGINGKHVPFSVDKCIEIFELYPDFRSSCVAWAENNANYQVTPDVSPITVKKS